MSNDAKLILGDNLAVLPTLAAGSVDAVVTDPPYGMRFMGMAWDGEDIKQQVVKARASRPRKKISVSNGSIGDGGLGSPAQKAGSYDFSLKGNVAFQEWCLACALEDAGFEMRDTLMWLYGSGFPKGKGCLKPAFEPVLLCRKPGPRVLPLGIKECQIGTEEDKANGGKGGVMPQPMGWGTGMLQRDRPGGGRWPANVAHDGSAEVLEAFAAFGEKRAPQTYMRGADVTSHIFEGSVTSRRTGEIAVNYGDSGTAARFFYTAKAGRRERWFYCGDCRSAYPSADRPMHLHDHYHADGKEDWSHVTAHPTQKPEALMRWLVKLVCPPGGLCLDPFAGSGTTGVACVQTGRRFVGVEMDAGYHEIAQKRIAAAQAETPLFTEG